MTEGVSESGEEPVSANRMMRNLRDAQMRA